MPLRKFSTNAYPRQQGFFSVLHASVLDVTYLPLRLTIVFRIKSDHAQHLKLSKIFSNY